MTNSTTRKALYTALMNAFAADELSFEGIDNERAVELLEKDIANLNKPRVSKKEAAKREAVDAEVLSVLEYGKQYKATEIVALLSTPLSVQAVVASLKRLKAANEVSKIVDGKTTLFALADAD